MTNRISILKNSLINKNAVLDQKLENHFKTVGEANGQPLNDKRNGFKTLERWEKQNDSIRSTFQSIEKTERAIEKEEAKIARVNEFDMPSFLRKFVERGEITQWRKHPNRFFVAGVDKGRIIWNVEKKTLGYSFLREIPSEQYPIFRDVFNRVLAEYKLENSND